MQGAPDRAKMAKAIVDFFIAVTILALVVLVTSGIMALIHLTSPMVGYWGSHHDLGRA